MNADTARELKYLRQAYRYLGAQWSEAQQKVVRLSEDEYPHPELASHPDIPEKVREKYKGRSLFKVKQKEGGMVFMVPKPAQLDLLTHIYLEMAQGKPVFIVILKARQIGFSTMIALLFLALSIVKEATETIVAAHVEPSAKKIFSYYQRAYDHIPNALRPLKKHNNSQQLKLKENESEIATFVAKEGSMGVSTSTTYAHFSEMALWKDSPGHSLSTALDSMVKKVGAIAVIETTSRGRTNDYAKLWYAARADQEEYGKPTKQPWLPIFFSWMDDHEYNIPLTDTTEFTQDELAFKELHNCSLEQLHWRQQVIAAKTTAMGHTKALAHFNRENPTTEEDAFKAGGDIVFDADSLDWLRASYLITKAETKHYWPHAQFPQGKYWGANAMLQGITSNNERGALRVYAKPRHKGRYILSADPSRNEGPNPDRAAFHVIDVDTLEQVAVFQGFVDPHSFGDLIVATALIYNQAFIVVESNSAGLGTCQRIYREIQYPYFYNHSSARSNYKQSQATQSLGFPTNRQTRPEIIANGERFIRERKVILHDEETFDELESFRRVYDETKHKYREEAEPGEHDDLVMSLLIGLYVGNLKYDWHAKMGKSHKEIPKITPDDPHSIHLDFQPEKKVSPQVFFAE